MNLYLIQPFSIQTIAFVVFIGIVLFLIEYEKFG